MDIGNRVKMARIAKELTLDELALKTGLSKSFLSNIENNRTSPSIASLEKIAQSLEIPLSILFMQKSFQPRIIKSKDRDKTLFGRDNRTVEWISNMPFSNLEMLILEIPPQADPDKVVPMKSHPGEECHLVLEGKLRGTYGTEIFLLEAGDSFHWDCSVPHKVENIGQGPARIIIALNPPSFASNVNATSAIRNGEPVESVDYAIQDLK
jgi:transcriptional regulator with XRE-family HTH domain